MWGYRAIGAACRPSHESRGLNLGLVPLGATHLHSLYSVSACMTRQVQWEVSLLGCRHTASLVCFALLCVQPLSLSRPRLEVCMVRIEIYVRVYADRLGAPAHSMVLQYFNTLIGSALLRLVKHIC